MRAIPAGPPPPTTVHTSRPITLVALLRRGSVNLAAHHPFHAVLSIVAISSCTEPRQSLGKTYLDSPLAPILSTITGCAAAMRRRSFTPRHAPFPPRQTAPLPSMDQDNCGVSSGICQVSYIFGKGKGFGRGEWATWFEILVG